jgi:hypothetical protein
MRGLAAKRVKKADYIGVLPSLPDSRRRKVLTTHHDDYSSIMLKALADPGWPKPCRVPCTMCVHGPVGLRAHEGAGP